MVSKDDVLTRVNQLESCVIAVHKWLSHNWLSLNPKKSDVIQFNAGRRQSRVEDVASVAVSDVRIKPSPSVKSLGVVLDSSLAFDQHIANVLKRRIFTFELYVTYANRFRMPWLKL